MVYFPKGSLEVFDLKKKEKKIESLNWPKTREIGNGNGQATKKKCNRVTG